MAMRTQPRHAKSAKARKQPRHAKGSKKGGEFKPDWSGRKPPKPAYTGPKADPPPAASSSQPRAENQHDTDNMADQGVHTPPPPNAPPDYEGHSHVTHEEFGEALTWTLPDGTLHNENGPAVIKKNGTKKWFINGILHNSNGPAVTTVNGSEEWHINGQLHREDGPAVIISPEDGDGKGWYEGWYKNGQLHRKGGPAVTTSEGTKMWFKNGKLSRWFGPAVVHSDGRKEWCGVGKVVRGVAIGLIIMKIFTRKF